MFLFEIVKMWMRWEILNWACLSSVIIRIHITHRSDWDYCRDYFYVFFRLWWWVKLEISLFKIIIYLVYHMNYIQRPCFQSKLGCFRRREKGGFGWNLCSSFIKMLYFLFWSTWICYLLLSFILDYEKTWKFLITTRYL